MQPLSKLSVLATLIALTSALARNPRAITPSATIVSYPLPACMETSALGASFAAANATVSANNCTSLSRTLSFQSFLTSPCPRGMSAEVTVYGAEGCEGKGVVETGLGAVSEGCVEDFLLAGGAVTLGGRSALLTCVGS